MDLAPKSGKTAQNTKAVTSLARNRVRESLFGLTVIRILGNSTKTISKAKELMFGQMGANIPGNG